MQETEAESFDVLTVVTWDGATGFGLDTSEVDVDSAKNDDTIMRLGYSTWVMYHSGFKEVLLDVHIEICREDEQGIRRLYAGSPWDFKKKIEQEHMDKLFDEDEDGVFFLNEEENEDF